MKIDKSWDEATDRIRIAFEFRSYHVPIFIGCLSAYGIIMILVGKFL